MTTEQQIDEVLAEFKNELERNRHNIEAVNIDEYTSILSRAKAKLLQMVRDADRKGRLAELHDIQWDETLDDKIKDLLWKSYIQKRFKQLKEQP